MKKIIETHEPVAAEPSSSRAEPPVINTDADDPPPERLQRVTFVPIDTLLEPYLTPAQYERMVVEEILPDHSTRRWEKRFNKDDGAWVDHAVISPRRTPPRPRRVPSPRAPRYLDEPANTAPLIGQENTSYAGDLFTETDRYARLALAIANTESFDIIHAHDWMTFEAAMAVAAASGKPLVLQIHSTEVRPRPA